MNVDELFAELRGLLSAPIDNLEWRGKMLRTLSKARSSFPEEYRDIWLPYLYSFGSVWEEVIFPMKGIEKLEKWAELAPFACFDFKKGYGSQLTLEGLLSSLRMENLRRLECYFPFIDDQNVELLSSSTQFQSLRSLVISNASYCNTNIGDEIITKIANSASFKKLRELWLTGNEIGEKGIVALANSPHVQHLQVLNLSGNPIGDAAAIALANSPHVQHLQKLHISGCGIGDKGAIALANSPYFKELQHLSLSFNLIGDEGHTALACSIALPKHIRLCYSMESQPFEKEASLQGLRADLGLSNQSNNSKH